MKPFLIITFGYTATGKSTIARKISRDLNINLVSSSGITHELIPEMTSIEDYLFGTPSNNKKNEIVYGEINSRVSDLVKERKAMIVDAFFPFRKYREGIYKISDLGYNVAVLECICNNEEIIKKRICERVCNQELYPYTNERARNMEVYYSWIGYVEPIAGDTLPNGSPLKIIRYDTEKDRIKLINFPLNGKAFASEQELEFPGEMICDLITKCFRGA